MSLYFGADFAAARVFEDLIDCNVAASLWPAFVGGPRDGVGFQPSRSRYGRLAGSEERDDLLRQRFVAAGTAECPNSFRPESPNHFARIPPHRAGGEGFSDRLLRDYPRSS